MLDLVNCECGLTYVRGAKERRHTKYHREYRYGPVIPALNQLDSRQLSNGFRLFVIDESVPYNIRKNLAEVARVARRSMRDYPAGYDGVIDEEERIMMLLADDENAIAMIIIALGALFWKFEWLKDGRLDLIDRVPCESVIRTVCRIWVAKNYRRGGLASFLIEAAAEHYRMSTKNLGWELPLTDDGMNLVRKLLPEKWFGVGNGDSVRETIGTAAK